MVAIPYPRWVYSITSNTILKWDIHTGQWLIQVFAWEGSNWCPGRLALQNKNKEEESDPYRGWLRSLVKWAGTQLVFPRAIQLPGTATPAWKRSEFGQPVWPRFSLLTYQIEILKNSNSCLTQRQTMSENTYENNHTHLFIIILPSPLPPTPHAKGRVTTSISKRPCFSVMHEESTNITRVWFYQFEVQRRRMCVFPKD